MIGSMESYAVLRYAFGAGVVVVSKEFGLLPVANVANIAMNIYEPLSKNS